MPRYEYELFDGDRLKVSEDGRVIAIFTEDQIDHMLWFAKENYDKWTERKETLAALIKEGHVQSELST